VHPEGDPELLERDLLVETEAELCHHTPRLEILLGADADDPRKAEPESVSSSRRTAFRRQPLADVGGIDQPAELRLAGPGAVVGEPDSPDQLTGFEQLGRP
jgi:hypothetical protein